jgi:hypothetical protein
MGGDMGLGTASLALNFASDVATVGIIIGGRVITPGVWPKSQKRVTRRASAS